MLDTKRLIKSLESSETKREFDFESRKFNLLKSEYESFRYSASELKDVELNQLSSEIADKFEKCVNLFEKVKDKFCDKTNPLNESENDCDDDDMGPADSVSLIAASSTSVTSSKSSIVKQIELERIDALSFKFWKSWLGLVRLGWRRRQKQRKLKRKRS